MSTVRSFWGRRRPIADEDREGVFTKHVRALSAGRPLEASELGKVWSALRATLRNELRRRGLWESPPVYLGIYGWMEWEPNGVHPQSALEELLAECYSYIFVQRLKGLESQLKIKPNIDGLVFLNIRHFIHERQREHDPLGSAVFDVVRSAVRMAIVEEELRVVGGDEGIRNDTILSFTKETAVSEYEPEKLQALVSIWNSELLPDLVTLRGQRQEEVARRMHQRLSDLRGAGIDVFLFRDIINYIKADVRARWAAILDQSQGETTLVGEGEETRVAVRSITPDLAVEEREQFRWLVDCVLTRLRRKDDVSEKTREYLATLWQFVRLQASEGIETALVPQLGNILHGEPFLEEESPSLRKLSESLRIPRKKIPELYRILGSMLEDCRAASRAARVSSPRGGINGEILEIGPKSQKSPVS